ncbi:hypothetical protein V6N12_001489 [Hibiscus sabdariffa]|uniref:Reverse transcriptase zinc-binding domain-containing protein n=1 Tax=Hibiscus sabdariffa TaxID=183260 RepID=A0ABR2BSM0_9ROSI
MIRNILAIPTPEKDAEDDMPVWRWEEACVLKIPEMALEPKEQSWSLAWSFERPQHSRHFLWLVLRNMEDVLCV